MSRRGFTSRNGGPYAYLVNTAMELGIINLRQQSNFYFHDVQKTQKIPKIKQPKCKKSTKLKNAKKSENPEITVTFLKKKNKSPRFENWYREKSHSKAISAQVHRIYVNIFLGYLRRLCPIFTGWTWDISISVPDGWTGHLDEVDLADARLMWSRMRFLTFL